MKFLPQLPVRGIGFLQLLQLVVQGALSLIIGPDLFLGTGAQIVEALHTAHIVVFRPAGVVYPQKLRPVREQVRAALAIDGVPVRQLVHGGPVPEGQGVPLQNAGNGKTLRPVGGDALPLRRLQLFLPGIAPGADLVPRQEVLLEGPQRLLAGPSSAAYGPKAGFLCHQHAGALPVPLQHQGGEVPVLIGLDLRQGARDALVILTGRQAAEQQGRQEQGCPPFYVHSNSSLRCRRFGLVFLQTIRADLGPVHISPNARLSGKFCRLPR